MYTLANSPCSPTFMFKIYLYLHWHWLIYVDVVPAAMHSLYTGGDNVSNN